MGREVLPADDVAAAAHNDQRSTESRGRPGFAHKGLKSCLGSLREIDLMRSIKLGFSEPRYRNYKFVNTSEDYIVYMNKNIE